MSNTLVHRLEYAAVLALGAMIRLVPRRLMYGSVRVLGMMAFDVLRIRRTVTLDNLRLALGEDCPHGELVRIARRAYGNMGMTFLEILMFPEFAGRTHEIVEPAGFDIIESALARGRGLILVSAHFGSWEMIGGAIAEHGIPVAVVAKRQANDAIDRLINRYRGMSGMRVIPLGAPIKHIVRALRNGEAVGLISDQDARRRGVFVKFFGTPASTPAGAAQLALRYGAPVVMATAVRTSPGRYRAIVEEIPVRQDDTVESLTQRYTGALERAIRRYPDQYFWMHRRWKTKPGASTA